MTPGISAPADPSLMDLFCHSDLGSSGSRGEGNTIPPPILVDEPEPKRKRPAGAKRWCFTWNNYPADWLAPMAPGLDGSTWCCGEEVGEGTPHLQGYVEFVAKVRPVGYRGFPLEIHWEAARGDRAQNLRYCAKEGGRWHGNLKKVREIKFIDPNLWWEQEILKIVDEDPDDRTIHWYWSTAGHVGKTAFTKYLVGRLDAIILSGKGADVRNAICTYVKDKKTFPDICVFPIPKSHDEHYVSYEALENCKDMCFYSGKYEGGAVVGPCPHLIVLCNFAPDQAKLSSDRWHVVKID